MLVIYRINAGHQGEIVSLDTETPSAAMDLYLDQADAPETDYIEIAEGAMDPAELAALVASVGGYGTPGRFYVAEVDGAPSLVDGGE